MDDIDWGCLDCGMDTRHEYYTVQEYLWYSYGAGDALLCIGCLEDRMGRELRGADFPHYLINVVNRDVKSDRLVERLLRH